MKKYLKKKRKKYRLLFVGTKKKKKKKLQYLNKYFRVRCYGLGWKMTIFHKLNNLYNSSKIILNFNRNGDGFS